MLFAAGVLPPHANGGARNTEWSVRQSFKKQKTYEIVEHGLAPAPDHCLLRAGPAIKALTMGIRDPESLDMWWLRASQCGMDNSHHCTIRNVPGRASNGMWAMSHMSRHHAQEPTPGNTESDCFFVLREAHALMILGPKSLTGAPGPFVEVECWGASTD